VHAVVLNLGFFTQQGRHAAPTAVMFCTEEITESRFLHTKYHTHRCRGGGGPKNGKFYQILKYKCKQIWPFSVKGRVIFTLLGQLFYSTAAVWSAFSALTL